MRIPKPKRATKGWRRPAPLRKRASQGQLRKLADDLMSLYVRHKAGWTCWVCQSERHEEMQMAHLYPKGAHPCGRYMETNVRCCCSRCHTYYTHRVAEWTRLLVEKQGQDAYDRLGQEVDVRLAKRDYKAEILYWDIQLRRRDDLWKVAERYELLVAKGVKLGVLVESLKEG